MKIALVIGHKKSSPGASNKSGLTEFAFNDQLSVEIDREINDNDIEVQRIYRRTLKLLPGDINNLKPDFIISLHCNAYNKKATGTETLYYHNSEDGKFIAEILNEHLVKALNLKDRGIKPKTSEDRGGYLLRYTKAPCVIAEPFFIDNDSDLKIAIDNREKLIKAYVNGIKAIVQKL